MSSLSAFSAYLSLNLFPFNPFLSFQIFSCAYTWDSPLGKKKLRAVVIAKECTKATQLDAALKHERTKKEDNDGDVTVATADSDDESVDSVDEPEEPLVYSLKKGVKLDARELNKTARYRSPRRKAVFGRGSRSYNLSKVGRQKDLPCPSAKEAESGKKSSRSSNLVAHTRIAAGTKILSFSDSTWLAEQVQAGKMLLCFIFSHFLPASFND